MTNNLNFSDIWENPEIHIFLKYDEAKLSETLGLKTMSIVMAATVRKNLLYLSLGIQYITTRLLTLIQSIILLRFPISLILLFMCIKFYAFLSLG